MPPNTKAESLPTAKCAAPFKDEPGGSGIADSTAQNANPSEFVSLRRIERPTDPNRTSNTIHEYTYELDKYRKNAMLLFHYDGAYEGSRDTANKVKSTFEKYRFEVDIHHNVVGDEVKIISEAFFQRDFDEYGAASIIVIGNIDPEGFFTTSGAKFTDTDILSHMSTANLQNKPKIIVFECQKIPKRDIPKAPFNVHILDYNFPATAYIPEHPDRPFNPLSLFCDRVETLGDQQRLDTIFYRMFEDSRRNNWIWLPSYPRDTTERDPIFAYVNLPKRLRLWKTLQE